MYTRVRKRRNDVRPGVCLCILVYMTRSLSFKPCIQQGRADDKVSVFQTAPLAFSKVSALRATHLRSIPVFAVGLFSRASHTSDLKVGTPVDYPVRRPALQGHRSDWLPWCQYTGQDRQFALQLLSQSRSKYHCLSRSVPEIHPHVAGTLSNQPPTTICLSMCVLSLAGLTTSIHSIS